MKYYCSRCHRLYDDLKVCPECKVELTNGVDGRKPVTITSAYGFEKDRITAALEDSDIPYATRTEKKEKFANVIAGMDNVSYRIEVPFSYYKRANEILVGINAAEPDETEAETEAEVGDIPPQLEEKLKKDAEEFENMSPTKRTVVRILSIILLIVVAWLVIAGVDFVANAIKGMFA